MRNQGKKDTCRPPEMNENKCMKSEIETQGKNGFLVFRKTHNQWMNAHPDEKRKDEPIHNHERMSDKHILALLLCIELLETT